MIYLGINCGFGNKTATTSSLKHSIWTTDSITSHDRKRRSPGGATLAGSIRAVTGCDYGQACSLQTHLEPARSSPASSKTSAWEYGIYREGITTFYTLRRLLRQSQPRQTVNQAVINSINGACPQRR